MLYRGYGGKLFCSRNHLPKQKQSVRNNMNASAQDKFHILIHIWRQIFVAMFSKLLFVKILENFSVLPYNFCFCTFSRQIERFLYFNFFDEKVKLFPFNNCSIVQTALWRELESLLYLLFVMLSRTYNGRKLSTNLFPTWMPANLSFAQFSHFSMQH
jgi:hypothetical protein